MKPLLTAITFVQTVLRRVGEAIFSLVAFLIADPYAPSTWLVWIFYALKLNVRTDIPQLCCRISIVQKIFVTGFVNIDINIRCPIPVNEISRNFIAKRRYVSLRCGVFRLLALVKEQRDGDSGENADDNDDNEELNEREALFLVVKVLADTCDHHTTPSFSMWKSPSPVLVTRLGITLNVSAGKSHNLMCPSPIWSSRL